MTMLTTRSEVSHSLRRLLPHMLQVTENRETLKSLESVWDVLNLLGQLSGTTTEMGDTKAAFASLTASLLHNLSLTTYNNRVQQLAAPAQVAIDILVRNLYERTADIGFLALDDALRDFAAAAMRGAAPERAVLATRLQAYVRRYTVYRDVILVAPDGEVLARLPDGPQVALVRDPLLAEVLASSAPYVEATVCSDMFPGESRNLLYGTRVLDENGTVLGALFLCFDFENETARIFDGLRRSGDWSVITLLDQDNRVIASSDPYQIMPGALVDAPYGDGQLMRFAGANYLAARQPAQGFQGYMGPPGWSALVLVPLEMAFELDDDGAGASTGSSAEPALVRAILRSGTAFPAALQAIPAQADAIQRELNRSVWNANIRQGAASHAALNPAFSRVLLAEIVRTGTRMKEVFTRSINELQTMTVSSRLLDCQFLAALAMDILDRTLYERANDCRWWALDPLLRGLLDDRNAQQRSVLLSERLGAINALYTVYDSLLLFDTEGVVVAASKPALGASIGQRLEAPWCARALALPEESYVVSEFVVDALYGNRPTYIYSAALRNDAGKIIGGIAAVFDSAPQLHAVLSSALPQSADAFVMFIDADNNVVASTDATRQPGSKARLPAALRTAALAGGAAQLIELDDQVLAVGAHPSSGYREYRGTEGQSGQRLLALVCVPLGAASAGAGDDEVELAPAASAPALPANVPTVDIASFYVGHYLLGVPAASVVEAIPFGGFVRLPNASEKVCGAAIYQGSTMLIYDLHQALGVRPRGRREDMLTVVLRSAAGRPFGVLVERLGAIPAVPEQDIAPVSSVFVGITPVLASVVKSRQQDSGPMLTLLAVEHMVAMLNQPSSERSAA
ncbi:MAG: chemotaxis protein CheW [Sphingomonadaceae bacterium]